MAVIIVKKLNFIETRVKQGLSLNKLAQKTGVHYTTLSRMERGKSNIRPHIAVKITKALRAEFDSLFDIVDRKEG